MRPFPLPAGVRIIDKAPLKDRLYHIAHRVMHHAVAEGGGLDRALLGVGHDEFAVATVAVSPGPKLPAEPHEMLLEVAAELQDGGAIALARAGIAVCAMQILEINDLVKKIHGWKCERHPWLCGRAHSARSHRGTDDIFPFGKEEGQ